jgi:hypothetical protein
VNGITAEDAGVTIAHGRTCGSCSLCCKVMSIAALGKPQGIWCKHCEPGKGCTIYRQRPGECRQFYCSYLTTEALGEEWRPTKSRIVLSEEAVAYGGSRMAAHVDPGRPDAWKAEPYYSQLKAWAVALAPERRQVIVGILRRRIVILPNKDVDVGDVADDELVMTSERRTPHGVELDAIKIKKDDPRLVGR